MNHQLPVSSRALAFLLPAVLGLSCVQRDWAFCSPDDKCLTGYACTADWKCVLAVDGGADGPLAVDNNGTADQAIGTDSPAAPDASPAIGLDAAGRDSAPLSPPPDAAVSTRPYGPEPDTATSADLPSDLSSHDTPDVTPPGTGGVGGTALDATIADGGGILGSGGTGIDAPASTGGQGSGGASGSGGVGYDALIAGSGGIGVDAPAWTGGHGSGGTSGSGGLGADAPATCGTGTHNCNGSCVSNYAPETCGPTECINSCKKPVGGSVTCDGTACVPNLSSGCAAELRRHVHRAECALRRKMSWQPEVLFEQQHLHQLLGLLRIHRLLCGRDQHGPDLHQQRLWQRMFFGYLHDVWYQLLRFGLGSEQLPSLWQQVRNLDPEVPLGIVRGMHQHARLLGQQGLLGQPMHLPQQRWCLRSKLHCLRRLNAEVCEWSLCSMPHECRLLGEPNLRRRRSDQCLRDPGPDNRHTARGHHSFARCLGDLHHRGHRLWHPDVSVVSGRFRD